MIAQGWLCSHCNGYLWQDEGGWTCANCGREYNERDGGLVPLVQPGQPDEGGRHSPRSTGRRHSAGWRERRLA